MERSTNSHHDRIPQYRVIPSHYADAAGTQFDEFAMILEPRQHWKYNDGHASVLESSGAAIELLRSDMELASGLYKL
jgi:hypothetical protein